MKKELCAAGLLLALLLSAFGNFFYLSALSDRIGQHLDCSAAALQAEDSDTARMELRLALKIWLNADGSLPESGEWLFTGETIAQLSREGNRSVLFTVGAQAADGTILAGNAFLYDIAHERFYVTISEDGVPYFTSNCSRCTVRCAIGADAAHSG